jgi:hypothetical protein
MNRFSFGIATFTGGELPDGELGIFVANADGAGSYTVSDNLGDSVTRSLASIGACSGATFSLSID